jgi:hypothetical protein
MRLAPSHECLHRDWFFSAPFTTQFTVDVAHRDQGLAGAEPNLLSVSPEKPRTSPRWIVAFFNESAIGGESH